MSPYLDTTLRSRLTAAEDILRAHDRAWDNSPEWTESLITKISDFLSAVDDVLEPIARTHGGREAGRDVRDYLHDLREDLSGRLQSIADSQKDGEVEHVRMRRYEAAE